ESLVRERGLVMAHSTNEPLVIAGAATLTLEILEESPGLQALVIAVGGGSQAVGALTVARELRPDLKVYGVQAERASAIHDSWHAGHAIARDSADTFADGLATRNVYDLTFPALREGLAGFVTVTEGEIAEALRLLLRTTHNLAEGAGAAGLAGLLKLRDTLAGAAVVVVDRSGSVVRASGWGKVVDAPAPSRIPPSDDMPDQLLDGIGAAIDEARRLCAPTRRVVAVELDKRRFYSVSAGTLGIG